MGFVGRHRYRIAFSEFAIAFSAFAAALGLALLAAETTMDLGFYRTVYTIWATTILVTPALCAFALPGNSERKQSVWILFWTFAFVVYVVHMGYALLSVYHGSFQEFLQGQGVFPAIINVVFTAWWAFDLALAWFAKYEPTWIQKQRIAAHIFIGLTFAASTIILKHGFINVLGILMAISVIVCLMVRFDSSRQNATVASPAREEVHVP